MDFVLDASFALRWWFEDEATQATESVLTCFKTRRTPQSCRPSGLMNYSTV